MRYILEHDGAKADDEALLMIARAAEGGMRDAFEFVRPSYFIC